MTSSPNQRPSALPFPMNLPRLLVPVAFAAAVVSAAAADHGFVPLFN
ncbi:MAG: hypothetical protein RLZZ15_1374, partial [Verrucomicrobiota bacterium]